MFILLVAVSGATARVFITTSIFWDKMFYNLIHLRLFAIKRKMSRNQLEPNGVHNALCLYGRV